ncbi:MAG: DUF2027 domain-containing protein [Raineya sp.]
MNIGDKVRLLHGTESGVIVSIKGAIIEVEIENGLSIPVSKSEIVVVDKEEAKRFGNSQTNGKNQSVKTSEVKSVKGLFLALLPLNTQKFSLYFINNTDWDLPLAIHKSESQDYVRTIAAACLQAKTTLHIEDVSLAQLDQWGSYTIQAVFAQKLPFQLQETLLKTIRFRANHLKKMQEVPILQKNGYLLQIDRDETEKLALNNIEEHILEKQTSLQPPKTQIQKPAPEVDLHIGSLLKEYQSLSNEEIFKYQFSVFEKSLDSAIATGMEEIVFIHGVGNGTLRRDIHKCLSKHPNVAYYQDAQKNKFGYGATYVKIK